MTAFEVLTRSGSNEWYTPPDIIEAARRTMGSIALDPASNEHAQTWIQAAQFYTQAEDGFAKDWVAPTLWLNPPYGQKNLQAKNYGACAWLQKAIDHYRAKDIAQAVLLCRGDSRAARELHRVTISLIADRIPFINPETPDRSNPVPGTRIFYLGPNWSTFGQQYAPFGVVVAPWDPIALG